MLGVIQVWDVPRQRCFRGSAQRPTAELFRFARPPSAVNGALAKLLLDEMLSLAIARELLVPRHDSQVTRSAPESSACRPYHVR